MLRHQAEYIYRNTIADENTLVIGISQSGETAATNYCNKTSKREKLAHFNYHKQKR